MRPRQNDLKTLHHWRTSTFLVMLFGYIGYYLIRQNLSAAFPLMHEALGYTNAELRLIAASSAWISTGRRPGLARMAQQCVCRNDRRIIEATRIRWRPKSL